MAIPADKKDQAIYHTIMGELHRLQGVLLSLQTIAQGETAEALRDHFTREQSLSLGKLTEWRQRRPAIYSQAQEDFQRQMQQQ